MLEHQWGRSRVTSERQASCESRPISARPRLHFVEQPHIFNRDDCLAGEGLHQPDLGTGKWPNLAPCTADDADRVSLLEYWNCHEGPVLCPVLKHLGCPAIIVRLGQYILELNRLAVYECTAHDEVARGGARENTVK